jgi:hypothetical protein
MISHFTMTLLQSVSSVMRSMRSGNPDHSGSAPPLCAKMSETVPPPEITEEGETG